MYKFLIQITSLSVPPPPFDMNGNQRATASCIAPRETSSWIIAMPLPAPSTETTYPVQTHANAVSSALVS